MQDFTFGPLTQIEQRLTRLRQQRSGVQHRHQTLPLDPLPGQAVVVQALTGPHFPVDRVTLYYTTDGSEPQGGRGEAQVGVALAMEPAEVEWDLIDWGYLTLWRATLPPQPEGTKVIYKIGAWHSRGGGPRARPAPEGGGLGGPTGEVFADNGAPSSLTATRFALAYDTLTPPDWIWDTSLYFVFLDRFAPTPGQRFRDDGTPRGFSGGTLRGVIDKLGYIAELGANCVWLSPCFEGPAYHGYHITDYLKVEPRWGSNADLVELVRQAHSLGIRVLLDFVPNHSARQHPYFQAAQADQASPYYPWYTFTNWPHEYEMFYTARELPKLNLEHAEARAWMIDAGRYWLEEVGIDGYRLDHAAGPSHHFWTDFRRATRAAAPDSFTVGEVVEAADTLRTYAGRLDGVLDFMFVDAARRFFAYDGLDAAQFDTFLTRHDGYFGQGLVRPTFIDNHDMNRFLFVAGNDKDRLRLAATCMFTLPQPPVVYYGTEVGMSQARDKRDRAGQGDAEARRPMWWDDRQDHSLLRFFQRLYQVRQAHPALRRGHRVPLLADAPTGLLAYQMTLGDDSVLVALNNSGQTHSVALPLALGDPPFGGQGARSEGLRLVNALDDTEVAVTEGVAQLQLGPRAGVVLTSA